MSSKKRVSVFARLGPAGPASPDEALPSHRRYSTDKHLEKSHHSHSLPPPSHVSHSHTHSASRDDSLRDRERERKPSHQDYEDKKQLHYRDAPPQPLPSSSRQRSHKHYHDDPDHLDYPDDTQAMGRSEKRSSLPSSLPLPPPPPPRKSRDLADRLSPTGKDILSKPFMGYEDKLSKLTRGSSEGARGAGGGKGRRTTPPEKRVSPPVGGMESEGEVGEGEVGEREEGRRKRPRTDKKPKLEGSGHVADDGRRLAKTHPTERERELRERGGKEKTERDRRGWSEKPLPSSSVPAPEGGGGEGKDSRARPERGGRVEEREGRRKREDEWPESRELVRKRKREFEGDCTPPPDNSKRVRSADYVSSSSKEHPDTRLQPSDSIALSREEKHSRLSKETDPLERKRRYEGSLESSKELLLPKSKETDPLDRKRRYEGSLESSKELPPPKSKETDPLERKRRYEGSLESSKELPPPKSKETDPLERKRRYEGSLESSKELPPPKSKEPDPLERKRRYEGSLEPSKELPLPKSKEPDPLERKRRYEGSLESSKELPPPKKPRSGEGVSSSRKYGRAEPTSSSSSVSGRKKVERHHKERPEQEHGGESEGEGGKTPKLDWSSIRALSPPKPKPASTSALQRFSPGAVFSRLGVSRSLAGATLYREVSSAVAKQLAKDQETLSAETGNRLPEALLEQPFGDSEFAMTGVSWIRNAKENCRVCVNIGPCRRALLASADFALRRKLGKPSKALLPPSPSSATWSSEHFARAILLYNSLGTKASGKPAFRLESSEVGSLLIPK